MQVNHFRLQGFGVNSNCGCVFFDFGPLRTQSHVTVRREDGEWVQQTWPRQRAFVIELDARQFGKRSEVQSIGGMTDRVVPIATGEFWTVPMSGAKEYRWK